METIKLQRSTRFLEETLLKVPELVQRYLDAKVRVGKGTAEGKHFRIVIKDHHRDTGAGIEMSNELFIEKRVGESSWLNAHTIREKYRDGYVVGHDNWGLSFYDPMILEETENEVVYAIRTSDGYTKVYRFNGERPDIKREYPVLEAFLDTKSFKKTVEHIKSFQDLFTDPESFTRCFSAVRINTPGGDWCCHWRDNYWTIGYQGDMLKYYYNSTPEKADVVVLIVRKFDLKDHPYDPLCTSYQLYFWVNGQGVGFSEEYQIQNQNHRNSNTFGSGSWEVVQTQKGDGFIDFNVIIEHRSQSKTISRDFRVEWHSLEEIVTK